MEGPTEGATETATWDPKVKVGAAERVSEIGAPNVGAARAGCRNFGTNTGASAYTGEGIDLEKHCICKIAGLTHLQNRLGWRPFRGSNV